MHRMIRESITLTSKEGYLDNLFQIYNVAQMSERDISRQMIADITQAYASQDPINLVKLLLKLEKFPVDDIYIGILRKSEEVIKNNPETVKRIGNRLLSMAIEDLLKRCKQPMVDNRRMGELFHKWFTNLPYPKVSEETFLNINEFTDVQGNTHRIMLLDGSRKDYKEFANRNLGCGLDKELDILIKVNGTFIIGEAKYFSDFGGHQMGQFKDAIDEFLFSTQGSATRIAILDGVVWLDTNNEMNRKIRNLENIAMSALLFPKFLQDIQGTTDS